MTSLDELLQLRERRWLDHPIITESAILPTRPVKDAIARVMQISRKSRASIAFWADPSTGKSFCIQALMATVAAQHRDCGVLLMESVEDRQQAEGRLLVEILTACGFALKIKARLSEKREQVNRALRALAGDARHLFLVIDEAQEITNAEFGWLKAVINRLTGSGVKVTTVLFGQREMRQRRSDLQANGRSDLGTRFMKWLNEFRGLRIKRDMEVVCHALDALSEYPMGSGWSYTQFLFPRAYESGFRFEQVTATIWGAIQTVIPARDLSKGLAMDVVASLIANICIACKDADAPGFGLTESVVTAALKDALGDWGR